ncbi:twin-arginine translocase subunit TatC [Frigidibacter sp. MR17.14]|uniref:twin-arginine translocase subunit TatC n=1 Tax=Frigidibacter sp. MR17.14 TaxID=3126509 RepID=UPI003012B681
MTASTDEIDDSAAPLIEHLAELRTRVMWSLAAFVAAMCVCFMVWNPIFNFLTVPICGALEGRGQACGLVLIALQEGFFVAVNISLFGGLVLSFPIIAYQMWRFVAPGLYKSEKNAFLPFLIASPIMFVIGAAFAYYVVLPIAFDFFLSFQQGPLAATPTEAASNVPVNPNAPPAGIVFQGSVQAYLGLTMKFVLAFGLCFQLPVLLTLMGKAGLISADGLASVRKYAVVGILIVSALATPPDVLSQSIMFCAIYPLYEISIHLIRRIEKKREAKLRAEGLWVEDPEEPGLPEKRE